MKDNLKVSALQTNLVWENTKANLEKLGETMSGMPSTDLLLLPEMFSTGFSMQPEKFAEEHEGNSFQWMKVQAKKINAAVCGSLMTRVGDKFYNRLYFVEPSGKSSYYDKRHLFAMGEENRHYSPGKERLIVEYLGWKICPLVCYDLRFPVFSRNTEDYDLLLFVANWPAKRSNHWRVLLQARAIENQSYLAACNRVGADINGIDHSGNSMLLDFKGEILEEAVSKETVISGTFSHSQLMEGRKQFPVLEDRDGFRLEG